MGFVRNALKLLLPPGVHRALRRLLNLPVVRRIRYFGFAHYCPICRARVRSFLDFSVAYRHVVCPVCGLHPRHRLMWLYFTRKLQLFGPTPVKLLHIAPEKPFRDAFAKSPNIAYLSADLTMPRGPMVRMDLTKIPASNDVFDAIYCSHVLEHIREDRAAMRELLRVLRPRGWAILQVPIDTNRDATLEDPAIQTPEDRGKHYWQFDHVRLYGNDYQARLEDVGFEVNVDWFVRTFTDADVRRLGLDRNEGIYFCTKAQRS